MIMEQKDYFNHRKNYWLRQGFDEKTSEWMSESDWRRYNVDKLQHANKTK